jgi:hypothetical protein
MAALGRWRVSDVAGIPTTRIGPSPGAMVRGLGETPRKRATHIHVHMPSPAKVHDQAPPASNNPSATGFPISAGDTFTVGADCNADGFSLRRVRAGDMDKDELPGAGDDVFGEENPPGGRSLDALRRKIGPRPVHDQQLTSVEQTERLRNWQQYLDKIWAPRS